MKYPIHKDADGRWVHTWVRQSSIKTSDMCLERWRTDIFNLVSERIKDASTLGTVCHAVAEDALNSRKDGIAEMSLRDMNDAFGYYWEEAVPTIEVWNNYTPESAHEAGLGKIANWYDEVFPLVKPVLVEYTFDVPLIDNDERLVRMTGTVDLVEENRLWDWKFPGRDYTRERWQYERWDVQSIAYCYALGIPNFSYAVMHPDGVGVWILSVGRSISTGYVKRFRRSADCWKPRRVRTRWVITVGGVPKSGAKISHGAKAQRKEAHSYGFQADESARAGKY